MPELVACPSCGCKVQLAEVSLGRQIRCISCGQAFTASAEIGAAPPRQAEPAYPLHPDQPAPVLRRWRRRAGQTPLCPACHRPVSWEATDCPHCGHPFDLLDKPGQIDPATRRDSEPHRGGLIDTLGTISMIAGMLGLCTWGLGSLVALATGIPAWIMAGHDLAGMESGKIDPAGRNATAFGRNKAIVGMVLALVIGLFYVLFYMERWPL